MELSEKRSGKERESGVRIERKSSENLAIIIGFLEQGHVTTTYKKK